LAVLMISLCSISAFSQVAFGVNFQAGFPFYSGDDFRGDGALSYTAGAGFVTEFPFSSKLSVVGDLGYTYSMIGYELASDSYRHIWHKISLEALFKAKFSDGNVRPYVQLGPQVSFLLKGTFDSRIGKFDIDIDNRFVLGYSLGAGIETKLPGSGNVLAFGINYAGDFSRFINGYNQYANALTLDITVFF